MGPIIAIGVASLSCPKMEVPEGAEVGINKKNKE